MPPEPPAAPASCAPEVNPAPPVASPPVPPPPLLVLAEEKSAGPAPPPEAPLPLVVVVGDEDIIPANFIAAPGAPTPPAAIAPVFATEPITSAFDGPTPILSVAGAKSFNNVGSVNTDIPKSNNPATNPDIVLTLSNA